MDKSVIIVKSITYAIQGQQLLNNHGISAYIERTTGERYGCGYGIRVKTLEAGRAAQALADYGIRVVDILPVGGELG